MKKFFSILLALLLCLCTVMPAQASTPSFSWNSMEFCAAFNPILYNFIEESATWKSPDANTRIGTFTNSPIIEIFSKNGKVTAISMTTTISAIDEDDSYKKSEGLWLAMITGCACAAILNDFDVLSDMDVQEQLYEQIGNLYDNAFYKLDSLKFTDINIETITFCNVDITCTSFYFGWNNPLTVNIILKPAQ